MYFLDERLSYAELGDRMRKHKVAVLSWEIPNKSEVMTGVGRYVGYLAELGKFSREKATRIDLTFIVPGPKNEVACRNGYKIFFLGIPGFSNNHRYDEDVLYPSCESFTNNLLCGRRQIDIKKFDLVLATSFIFGGLISRIQHLDNIVYISHRPEFLREKLAKEFNVEFGDRRTLRKDAELESKAVRFSRCTVTVSEACRREISGRYGRNKIHVIPNGVDTNLFSRVEVPASGDKTVFAYVGRNHPEKGVPLLLKSAKRLLSRNQGKN